MPTRRPVGGATGLRSAQAEATSATFNQGAHALHSEKQMEERADRFYLNADMPVEKAPSIGAKTAALLEDHGVRTVGNLLSTDPDKLAALLNDRHIDAYTILTW